MDALMKLKGQSLVEDQDVEELRQYILQQLKTRQKHEQVLKELLEREVGR